MVTNKSEGIILNDLCARFDFVSRAWDLNCERKSSLMFTGNMSPEGVARSCFHAINKRGRRFFVHVFKGPNSGTGVEPIK